MKLKLEVGKVYFNDAGITYEIGSTCGGLFLPKGPTDLLGWRIDGRYADYFEVGLDLVGECEE